MNVAPWHGGTVAPWFNVVVVLLALGGATVPRSLGATAQQPGLDVTAYSFGIDLPDTGTAIRGRASILFTTGRGFDGTARLDLVGMTVERVRDVQTMDTLPFSYDGRVLSVPMPRSRQSRRGLWVEYHGSPGDGLIIRDNARGRRSFFGDNWPNRARHWLPVVDHPSDKARVTWTIRAPLGYAVVANGRLRAAPRVAGEPWVYSWGQAPRLGEAPIPTYTMVLGAAPMLATAHRPALHGRDTVPVEVWAYPEDIGFADSVPFRRATEMVEVMQRLVGPYPYSVLRHVQSSTRYGGMENSTVIFYAERGYVRRTMGEGVVRHETAHQWFGDAVTPRGWEEVWLSEGFASYFDGVIGAALDGDSVLTRVMRNAAQSYMSSQVTGRPIRDTAWAREDPNKMLSANTYPKGAWVLHMLRGVVGDSAFFQGVRRYYARYRDSSATTEQLRREMERAARTDLGWFFRQWLDQPGYPQLEVGFRVDSAARHAVLRIRQAQPAEWGRFTMPEVPVEFLYRGEVMARRTFRLDARHAEQTASFTIEPGVLPDEVRVDPQGTLLLRAAVNP